MTTNIERAVDLIANATIPLGTSVARGIDRASLAAQELADAGLLMPDLPEPDGQGQYTGSWWGVSGVAWQPEAVNEELPASIDTKGGGLILVHIDGDLLMSIKQEHAVAFAHKILAAHHHEQEQSNE